jgi:hypothetical protein
VCDSNNIQFVANKFTQLAVHGKLRIYQEYSMLSYLTKYPIIVQLHVTNWVQIRKLQLLEKFLPGHKWRPEVYVYICFGCIMCKSLSSRDGALSKSVELVADGSRIRDSGSCNVVNWFTHP